MGQFSITTNVTVSHPNSDQGQWAQMVTGTTTITAEFSNEVLISGGNAACLGYLYWSASPTGSSPHQIGSTVGPFGALSTPATFAFSASGVPGGSYIAAGFGPNTGPNTISMDITLFDDLTYCAYGARRRNAGPDAITTTYDIALAILTYAKAGAWAAVIGFLLGQVVNIPVLCSAVRPGYVQLTALDWAHLFGLGSNNELVAAKTKLAQWFLWCAWGYFCECVPGSPAAVDEPLPPQPKPPQLQDDPAIGFTCDNNDLCTQLGRVLLMLDAVIQRQGSLEQLVTLIQRQGVPFGYVFGAVRSGLSGDGQFDVVELVGVAVDITTLPSAYPSHGGDPDTYHNLGHISVGTADGWERSWWITHDPYLILPISGAITKVGYSFPSGIVATITDLVRQP